MLKWQWDSKNEEPETKNRETKNQEIDNQEIDNQEIDNQEIDYYPDEIPIHVPATQFCHCCKSFAIRTNAGHSLCGWCIDCPVNYCDIPDKFKRSNK